jgi:predicted phage tail protein
MGRNPALWIVILVVVVAWNIYDMTSPGEAPSQGVVILHWILLVCGLAGIAGGVMQLIQQKKRESA